MKCIWWNRLPSGKSGFRLVKGWSGSHSPARKAAAFSVCSLGDFLEFVIVDCLVCCLQSRHEASYHMIVGMPTHFPILIVPVRVFTGNSGGSYQAIGGVLPV